MIKFLLLGLGAIAFFCSACNDDVSSSMSDVVMDSSSSVAPVPVEESSSSESSNSAAPVPLEESSSAESSSSKGDVSSSSVKSSSSGKNVYSSFLWDGTTDLIGRVETGSPEETSGYWYDYNDNNYGGTSKYTIPADIVPNESGNFFGPLIDAYGCIRATITFGEGYEKPYVGFGFNVWSENQEGVNVSEWGGICLSYQSTIPFVIELGVEDEELLSEYAAYRASVPEAKGGSIINIRWEAFSSGCESGPSIYAVLKKVSAIRLKFEGNAGTTGDIRIQTLGSLYQCSTICKRQ